MRSIRHGFWFIIGVAIAMIAVTSWATEPPRNRPPDNRPPDRTEVTGEQRQTTDVDTVSRSSAGAAAGALAVGRGGTARAAGGAGGDGGAATADAAGGQGGIGEGGEGGTAEASSGGNTFDNDTTNSNFYVARSLPPSFNSCALSADGGGGNNGKAGFLGIQWLDHGCVMDQLAELEDNADLKSRLKCGNRRYRRAVAFDQPGREKHKFCFDYTKTIYLAEIALQRKALEESRAHAIELIRAELAGEIPQGN